MEQQIEKTPLEKLNNGIKNSVMLKVFTITIIGLLLLIPTSSIKSLISERQFNQTHVIEEVSSKWGGEQSLIGPVLSIPYKSYYKSDNVMKYAIHHAHFLPEKLIVNGEVEPNMLERSIYEIILYNAKIQVSGAFNKPDFSKWDIRPEDILWSDAYLTIGIPDMSGVREEIKVNWDGSPEAVEAGVTNHDITSSGVTCHIPLVDSLQADGHKFDFNLDLNGHKSLNFVPLGKSSQVKLASTWPHPSFNGNFLPSERDVTDDGFTAEWKVFSLNRNFPQQWLNNTHAVSGSSFGVDLILPVDDYQKNMRSAKYALLIVAFTFVIFFLVEVLNKKKFHPFQYILVGLALILFYSLLLSFSEHQGFDVAYLISSVATVALITMYVSAVMKDWKITVITSVLLCVIYFFIYIILQLQDFALLVGSVGLFAALAVLMYFSRNIDWYNINRRPVEA
ncbi:cell envelope integrity protein CreD [Fulvivirga ligni]|uniref:cell envelope integrity protein CreD n=1 Tax=Fulvivirga ligni TaxID=2904246 RepID=UPI001EFEFC75|nr:cell envelope integrity protein CreD [Fulvivirga ligni]UII22478.1 cell envelope integrity protein CreD [Fulvivirga ligni]